MADRGAILQCGPGTSGPRPQGGQRLLGGLDRQRDLIDKTGGQRDQVRPCQGLGHQAADQLVAARPMGATAQTSLLFFCHFPGPELISSAETREIQPHVSRVVV